MSRPQPPPPPIAPDAPLALKLGPSGIDVVDAGEALLLQGFTCALWSRREGSGPAQRHLPTLEAAADDRIDAVFEDDDAGLRASFELRWKAEDGARLRIEIENLSVQASTRVELTALSLLGPGRGAARLWRPSGPGPIHALQLGFQSWDRTGVFDLADGRIRSHGATAVADPASGGGVLVAFEPSAHFHPVVHVAREAGVDGLALDARVEFDATASEGELADGLEPIRLTLQWDEELLAGLERFAEETAVAGAQEAEAPTGWCSWYRHYEQVDEDAIRANLEVAATLRPWGLRTFQIDDGWQRALGDSPHGGVGDWRETNDKFPSSLSELARAIADRGLEPGLWLAPLAVGESSRTAAQANGLLCRPSDAPEFDARLPWRGDRVAALDGSREATTTYLRDLAHHLSQEAGFRYLKLDFLYLGTGRGLNGEARADRPLEGSGVNAYRRAIAAFAQGCAPGTTLLGCGAPQWASRGLFPVMRTGPDVHVEFEAIRDAMRSSAARAFAHRRWWIQDPDCIVVRPPMSDDEARCWASWVALTTGAAVDSDELGALPEERLEILRRVLPVARGRARPVDLFRGASIPRCWHLEGRLGEERHDVIGLFDTDDLPRSVAVDLTDLGLDPDVDHASWDFWSDRPFGLVRGRFETTLAPRSCRVLALRPVGAEPVFVSSDRHVTHGLVDVLELRTSREALAWRAEGRVDLIAARPTTLTFFAPAPWSEARVLSAEDGEARLDSHRVEGGTWFRLVLERARGGETSFALEVAAAEEPLRQPEDAGAPSLERVQETASLVSLTWSGSTLASEADEEELQKTAASVASGAHLVLAAAAAGAGRRTPPAPAGIRALANVDFAWSRAGDPAGGAVDAGVPQLEAQLGDAGPAPAESLSVVGAPSLAIPLFVQPDGRARALITPPRGRGCALLLAPGDDAMRRCALALFSDRTRSIEWTEAWAIALQTRAAALEPGGRYDLGEAARHVPGTIDTADPRSEAEFELECPGGGALTSAHATDPSGAPIAELGRVVRGAERFVVPLDPAEEAAHPRPLVLVRRTAPEDFGKVLRVSLDDEDLGPWHLGNQGRPGCFSEDVLRVPAELLLDRTRARFLLQSEPGVELSGFRVRLLREDDPDGLWLTELDPDEVEGQEPRFDQNADGDALLVAGRLALRGLGMRAPCRFAYQLPDGYSWFEGRLGLDASASQLDEMRLRILVDGEDRYVSPWLHRDAEAVPARVRLDGGCELGFVAEARGGRSVLADLCEPVLLR